MRSRNCIDADWLFHLASSPDVTEIPENAEWRKVDLPHDWSVEATPHPDNPAGAAGGFFPGGLGWYRKEIDVPADLGSRHMIIEFDGVYMNSEVRCNGRLCGVRPYGYISFAYDITQFVSPGESAVIEVRVDNVKQKNCRWYSGSGVYRHVWLTTVSPVRMGQWGTHITTPDVTEDSATVKCEVTAVNDTDDDADLELCALIIDDAGCEIEGTRSVSGFSIPNHESRTASLDMQLPFPRLWSPDAPNLYTLRVRLSKEGEVLDEYDTRFGVRTIRFDADEGFFLNGEPLKLLGVNEHHDAGCLGAAVPDDVIRRRFRILKEMGCNAVRVAHNPASPAFLDLCDEMGLMVVEDAFDEWKDPKTEFGYGIYWDEWWERDLVDMIRRDRNHPSIVMWSVGNEIKEVREGRPEGLPIMKALREVCHREDSTRPMTCGCCGTRLTLAAGYGPLMDVVGYNGGGGGCFDYQVDHAEHPDMCMFASEVPHSLQTRGVYRTRTWYRDLARRGEFHWYPARSFGRQIVSGSGKDAVYEPAPAIQDAIDVPHYTDEEVFEGVDDHYQSSYDNALVRISSIDSWRLTKSLPYMCGEFRWTGFDYIGECYGWPAKSWNFGVIDLCGFPKDTYYFYQSEWTDKPMVHILPHWTWPGLEGKTIPVIAYSNCDAVELFLNGESLGTREKGEEMYMRWDVEYRPGKILARGYGMRDAGSGRVTVECEHETAGDPSALKVECDEDYVRADGTGIAHFVVTVVDDLGRFVPHADHDIEITVAGPAKLIGLENGDPIDSTNYKLNHRKVFHGMMLAVVQARDEAGTIDVNAQSEGLSSGACSVKAVTDLT